MDETVLKRNTMLTEKDADYTMQAFVGAEAPDFTLIDANGKEWRLSDHKGKVIALLFYPKDETLVCTRQLCSVRDNWAEYVETGAEVVGISPGTVADHLAFANRHSLPMTLLADVDSIVTRMYGYHSWLPVWATRAIVVVDATGIVRNRRIMLRSFRPSDKRVIATIYGARRELMSAQIEELTSRWKRRT